MKRIILRYELNRTTGVPHLVVPPGVLNEAERQVIADQLRLHYHQLVDAGGNQRVVRLRLGTASARFRLWVRPGASPRFPTLVLEQVPDDALANTPQMPRSWVEGLLDDWEDLVCTSLLLNLPPVSQAALARAVGELRKLGEGNPSLLAEQLLVAWLERSGGQDQARGSLLRLLSRTAPSGRCPLARKSETAANSEPARC